MQCGLFGREAPGFDATLRRVRRIELGGGAWIEHHPAWLEGHERVFQELMSGIGWRSERRMMYEREVDVPRLMARAPATGDVAELLGGLGRTLSERYQRGLENISLAHYRDGKDSVAFHGDKVGRLVDDCIVATVSVGTPRRFLLKPNVGGGSLSFDLGWGDLFVMGGTCQRTWQHAVPKRAHADPRISIMFRPVIPDAVPRPGSSAAG
jgi:alkylated DNA repair dioxygenase AlkB